MTTARSTSTSSTGSAVAPRVGIAGRHTGASHLGRRDRRCDRSALFRPPAGYGYQGSTASYTVGRGIPTVTVELGGGAVDQSEYVRRGVAGWLNVMRAIGMLPEDPTPPPPQVVLQTLVTLRPRAGGLLLPEATALHEELPKGGYMIGDLATADLAVRERL